MISIVGDEVYFTRQNVSIVEFSPHVNAPL